MTKRKKLLYICCVAGAAILIWICYMAFNLFFSSTDVVYTLELSAEEMDISDSSPVKLTATITPNNGDAVFIYSSSNTEIIACDQSGMIIPLKSGVAAAVVKAEVDGQSLEKNCLVFVTLPESIESDDVVADEPVVDEGPPCPAIPEPVIDDEGFLVSDNLIEYCLFNTDTAAWLYVPGTNINLPVAQKTSLVDREFYLNHSFNMYPKYSGSAFLDYRCHVVQKRKILDQQTVIFGHARGTDIFDQLDKETLRNSWFENPSNRYIYLNTPLEYTVWQIYACYYTNFDVESNQTSVTTPNFLLSDGALNGSYSDMEIMDASGKGLLFTMQQDPISFWIKATTWRTRMEIFDKRYAAFYTRLSTRDYGTEELLQTDKVLTLTTCADADSNVRYVVSAKLVKTRERS